MNHWARVSVRNDVVVDVQPLEGDPGTPTTASLWLSIDRIFDNLHARMTEQDSYLAAVVVRYDSQLGFPTNIEYRAKPNIADGGAVIELRNVAPLH